MKRRKGALVSGVSTNVLLLGLVSLLTDTSSEMIYPILPLFLTSIGATGLIIGTIEGTAEATASFLKVVSGWYSDKIRRRKRFITLGYGLSGLTKPLLAIVTNYWQVFGIRVAERVGKGIRAAPRDALIAESSSVERRGKAFGFHKAMDSTGSVIGPILALIVLLSVATVTTDTYRFIFLLSTIPAVVALIIIMFFIKEIEASPRKRIGKFFGDVKRLDRSFWELMAVMTVFFFGEISYAFFILRGAALGLSTAETLSLYIVLNIVFVFVALVSGGLSDRLGRYPVIMFSFSIFLITCLAMILAYSWALLGIAFVLYGVYLGTSEGVMKAFVTDVAPNDLRGTALGAYHTCVGFALLPGGIVAGLLWDNYGDWATFTFGAIMTLTAMVLLVAYHHRNH